MLARANTEFTVNDIFGLVFERNLAICIPRRWNGIGIDFDPKQIIDSPRTQSSTEDNKSSETSGPKQVVRFTVLILHPYPFKASRTKTQNNHKH